MNQLFYVYSTYRTSVIIDLRQIVNVRLILYDIICTHNIIRLGILR